MNNRRQFLKKSLFCGLLAFFAPNLIGKENKIPLYKVKGVATNSVWTDTIELTYYSKKQQCKIGDIVWVEDKNQFFNLNDRCYTTTIRFEVTEHEQIGYVNG